MQSGKATELQFKSFNSTVFQVVNKSRQATDCEEAKAEMGTLLLISPQSGCVEEMDRIRLPAIDRKKRC